MSALPIKSPCSIESTICYFYGCCSYYFCYCHRRCRVLRDPTSRCSHSARTTGHTGRHVRSLPASESTAAATTSPWHPSSRNRFSVVLSAAMASVITAAKCASYIKNLASVPDNVAVNDRRPANVFHWMTFISYSLMLNQWRRERADATAAKSVTSESIEELQNHSYPWHSKSTLDSYQPLVVVYTSDGWLQANSRYVNAVCPCIRARDSFLPRVVPSCIEECQSMFLAVAMNYWCW